MLHFLGIQESKMTLLDGVFRIKSKWVLCIFDYACSMARGLLGGLISIWDPNMFSKNSIWCDYSFIIIKGNWKNIVGDCFMVNIYGPQDHVSKLALWNRLTDFMHHHNGSYIMFGDMNAVRNAQERFGTTLNSIEADHFNSFIDSTEDVLFGSQMFGLLLLSKDRQGDPLSPFLFILVMEGLHNAFEEAVGNGLITGVNIKNSTINVSYLFYADDVIITTDWNAKDMDNIIRVLHVFYLASGLKINIHKSNIYGIGVNKDEVLSMASNACCIEGDIHFNYLGLPIGSNMKSIASWKTLVDHFHMRLSSWKANLLSIGGCLTLIKSVLGSPEEVTEALPNVRVTAIDHLWSDHNPILLHVSKSDVGPTPFKLFHSWLLRDSFEGVIKTKLPKLKEYNFGRNLLSHDKFRLLKARIKQ
ncbi:putative RNA-directed DNA polymerase, eukaryota, reverse transcriptase zinc-binding domain protein [Tanacetum coccineum]|uniref:RNA-directed DNA polymerase, eukaryota, reverse transcriptase zinc-binding domain protein n=1 Tax=Tanacetum coccineum TaxID=301880 RepID=A0ABQ4ZZW4_9ASTR